MHLTYDLQLGSYYNFKENIDSKNPLIVELKQGMNTFIS